MIGNIDRLVKEDVYTSITLKEEEVKCRTTKLGDEEWKTFDVAVKNAIKAIEEIFGVKVEKVNTLNTKAKRRRVGKYAGKTKTYKKAIVTLAEGSSIDL